VECWAALTGVAWKQIESRIAKFNTGTSEPRRLFGWEDPMRVLIDTNIFISRENHIVVPDRLQKLLNVIHSANVQILIHPSSVKEIQRDRDEKRKMIQLSKIKTYAVLEDPPDPTGDVEYVNIVGEPRDEGNLWITACFTVFKETPWIC
jgi:hypothetical protein